MTKNNQAEGGDALIQLRVPAALKARWVRESRAVGMKLTDWVVEKMERARMNVYKIPDAIAGQYHGAGYALAAIINGQLVALRYIEDVAPALEEQLAEGGSTARVAIMEWINWPDASPVVRELQALGEVSVGMCSTWEFVQL